LIEPPADNEVPLGELGLADDGDPAGVDDAEEDLSADDLLSRRFESWRRRSTVGAVGTAYARALQGIFYPGDKEPVITAEAPGDPPDADQHIRVRLDPDDPTKSVAYIPSDQGEPPSA
jgi:hypothetical protein